MLTIFSLIQYHFFIISNPSAMKQPITRSRLFVQHFNLLGENLQKKCIFRDIITSIINSRNEQTELIFFCFRVFKAQQKCELHITTYSKKVVKTFLIIIFCVVFSSKKVNLNFLKIITCLFVWQQTIRVDHQFRDTKKSIFSRQYHVICPLHSKSYHVGCSLLRKQSWEDSTWF